MFLDMDADKRNVVLLLFILILHLVGIIGFSVESLRPLVLPLSSVNLLISFLVLGIGYLSSWKKFVFFSIIAFFFGLTVEWIGVHTGYLFGNYSYGQTLGVKFDGIPLIIGVNWIMLSVCSSELANYVKSSLYLQVLLASSFMVFLDFLIEPIAISADFWTWENGTIPIYNYICWFVLSLPLNFFYQKIKIREQKTVPIGLYFIFVLFFGSLNLLTCFG